MIHHASSQLISQPTKRKKKEKQKKAHRNKTPFKNTGPELATYQTPHLIPRHQAIPYQSLIPNNITTKKK